MRRWTKIAAAVATACALPIIWSKSFARVKLKTRVTIDYIVPGIVAPIQQPSGMTCWATAATMMYAWKNNANYAIETVMDKAGATYRAKFDQDDGLASAEKPDFLDQLTLRSEVPMSYSITGWEQLLRRHGPLWVTTSGGATFSIHARILVGIKGDGSAAGTIFAIVDPADGESHSESVATFVKKFEDVARQDLGHGGELRPQVVHF